ncbi:MAG: hypothetical protein JWR77_2286 [Rhizorhabdus sp.]|nr:hypothetical protein [Rhizorhabdus sp.]
MRVFFLLRPTIAKRKEKEALTQPSPASGRGLRSEEGLDHP